jgi:iron(III) transport system permease protein
MVIIRRIVMPLLLPSLISGWIWVASRSLRDFSIPLILSTRDSRVLSVTMWHKWADGYPGQTAALGVMLIFALAVITIIGRLVVNRLSRQQET